MTAPDATVDPACRDLLAAIAEAVDVPHPASYDDRERRYRLLSERSACIQGAISGVMNREVPPDIAARVLRESVAESQPSYEPLKREAS